MWRTTRGTRSDATTAEVTTGSVGESTAPRRNASAQVSSGKSALPASASRTQRQRHGEDERARERAPVGAQELGLDEQPVGEEREDERELDEVQEDRRAGADLDDVEERQDDAGAQREHRDREHGAVQPAGQRRRDGEQQPEDEERLGEAQVHARDPSLRAPPVEPVARETVALGFRPGP